MKMHKELVIVFVLMSSISIAQKGRWMSANYAQGWLIPQFGLLDPIEENPYRSAELNFGFRGSGKNYAHQHYNYPEYGLSLFYHNFGDEDILGYAIGADYFFKINLIETVHFKLYSRTGFGMNYNSKVLDPVDNPLNIAKSSHLNFHFNHRWGVSYLISNPVSLNLGISFDHFSNANTNYPNHGYNGVSAYAGLVYQLQQILERTTFERWEKPNFFLLEAAFSMGFDHATFPTDRYYLIPTLLLDANYRPGNVLHLGVGGMVAYDTSTESKYGILDTYSRSSDLSVGIHASQTLNYNRISFTAHEGYYVHRYEELYQGMYNRVMFGYALNEKVKLNFALYTEVDEMRYVEVGVRWKLVD